LSDSATGRHVAIVDDVGHYPAYVPAELLADAGARVSLVTTKPMPGTTLDEATMARTLARMSDKGIRFETASAPVSIEANGLRVRNVWTGEERLVAADVVVAAVGNVADDALASALAAASPAFDVHVIGDCLAPRTALEAVREGHEAGRAL
jgi:NADPH-dependent 2,4-dienoyl-CoA reductase/sulfur reductase-like enzyme